MHYDDLPTKNIIIYNTVIYKRRGFLMRISTKDLKNERRWRASLGVDEKLFYFLLEFFKTAYKSIYGNNLEYRLGNYNKAQYCIQNEEDLLLYVLFSLKNSLTYEVLGCIFDMDASNAKRNQERGVQVLQKTLEILEVLPKRTFSSVEEFQAHFAQVDLLTIDATEQRRQRPEDDTVQRTHYSGKKKSYSQSISSE